jgi:plastocyanin
LIEPYDLEADPPVYTLGPVVIPQTTDGDVITSGQDIHAVITSGNTVTLTFADAGVYPYVDNFHAPGMEGVVVVMPAN